MQEYNTRQEDTLRLRRDVRSFFLSRYDMVTNLQYGNARVKGKKL